MAKQQSNASNIQKISPNVQLPAYLQDQPVDLTANELLKEFVVVPRMKIVQKQSSDELLKIYKPGDLLAQPVGVQLATFEQKLVFTPILFYPEWITWNPLELKGSEPAIAHRTMDKNDPIVAKAKDSRLWSEPFNPPRKVGNKEVFKRHVEHLNFIVVLHDHPFTDPIVLSFARSAHKHGMNLATQIRMRNAPMFACKFELVTASESNQQGDWKTIKTGPPTEDTPWVDEEGFKFMQGIHEQFRDLYKDNRIQANMDDAAEEVQGEVVNAANRDM